MNRILFICAIAMCFVLACNRGPQAPFDENDEVIIHGVYVNESGSVLPEQWVGFWINSPESFFSNFGGLDPEENDRTDSVGVYSETFMGGDLMDNQGATYQVAVMNYDPNWPDTTPAVACVFYPLAIDITLDTMKWWRGDPAVVFDNDNAVFSWSRMTTTHGAEPDTYYFQVKASQDGPFYTMWQQTMAAETTLTLPAYALPEAYAKKWRAIGTFPAPSQSDYGFAYLSDPDTTHIVDTLYQLLSLGKNCHAEAYAQSFTGATDGKWGPWPTYCVAFAANNVSWIYVDLSDTANTVNAVVLYDLGVYGNPSTPGFDLFVSNDTLNWGTAVVSNAQSKGYFYLQGFSRQGRYVKLQARDSAIGISGFREVCVFGN